MVNRVAVGNGVAVLVVVGEGIEVAVVGAVSVGAAVSEIAATSSLAESPKTALTVGGGEFGSAVCWHAGKITTINKATK